ncbi:LON peptidase substrate-binding domain-containing protein [soil metagenome]
MAIPSSLPALVLTSCNLFPHALLPLHIFEPRYQEMLKFALARDRMFCVITRRRGAGEDAGQPDSPDDLFDHATAGLIRACVKRDDGTSHLVLQGVRRIVLTSYTQEEPFRIAQVTPLDSVDGQSEEAASLGSDLVEIVSELTEAGTVDVTEHFFGHLCGICDPEVVADLVAYNFLRDPYARQSLLSMASVTERLRFLVTHLSRYLDGDGTGA